MYKKLLALSLIASVSTVSMYSMNTEDEKSGETGTGTGEIHDPLLKDHALVKDRVEKMNYTLQSINAKQVKLYDASHSAPEQSVYDGFNTVGTKLSDIEKELNDQKNRLHTCESLSNVTPVCKSFTELGKAALEKLKAVPTYTNGFLAVNALAQSTPLAAGWAAAVKPLVPVCLSTLATKAGTISALATATTYGSILFTGYASIPLCGAAFLAKCWYDQKKEFSKLKTHEQANFKTWETFTKHVVLNLQSTWNKGLTVGKFALGTAVIGWMLAEASKK